MNFRVLSLAVVALAGVLHGCGDSEPGGAVEPAAATVTVTNNKFEPALVTVKPGQTVEWVFKQGTHDVSSGPNTGGAMPTCTADNKFQSELKSTGTFRFKFATAGEYPYFCTPHCGVGQVAKVVVAP